MKGDKKVSKCIVIENLKSKNEQFVLIEELSALCDEKYSESYSEGYRDGFYCGRMEGERAIFDRIIDPYAKVCLCTAMSILEENGVCLSADASQVLNANSRIIIEKTREFLEKGVLISA